MQFTSRTFLFALMLIVFGALHSPGGIPADDHNPVGVTGIFNGNVQTAGSYDPMSHSAHRVVDDIVVPGSIGKYPLKMTRYYNSRQQYYAFTAIGLSPGWAHEYSWLLWSDGTAVVSPHGATYDFKCQSPVGVSEGWERDSNGVPLWWRLADGGRVHFSNGHADYIDDPNGQRTTITYDQVTGLRTKVTEPGLRYLSFFYNDTEPTDGTKLLTRVEAHGLGNATVTDWVNYSYTLVSPGGTGDQMKMLTRVDYSDSTYATYTYRTDNVRESPNLPPYTFKIRPVLDTCTDVRYNGPMRRITYDYQNDGPHGAILDEKNPDINVAISSISPALTISPPVGDYSMPYQFTETRADGPGRTFTYTQLSYHRDNDNPPPVCPDITSSGPPTQFLTGYTDFQGKTTWIGYDPVSWYITSVTDARGSDAGDPSYTTYYTRGPQPPSGIGQIMQIKHPDLTHIDYTYQIEPSPTPGVQAIQGHYVQSITDERGNQTVHTRDVNHRITRTDHKDSAGNTVAYEEFFYANNSFGLLSTHHLPSTPSWSGPYVHFQYDTRGLLIAKTNPTTIADWANAIATAPKTTYIYYTSGAWADRVQTMTLPANVSGLHASETYEYDKNGSGLPAAGRGLITKITHDGKYQSFAFDAYGNKLWEENELRKRTSYTYDSYNRLLTVKDPVGQTTGHTTSYTYVPTNGNGGSSYKHTTSNPDTVTTPTGIMTSNVYDQNFRKTQTSVAGNATWFHFDPVGNQDWAADPRGTAGRSYPNVDPVYTTLYRLR